MRRFRPIGRFGEVTSIGVAAPGHALAPGTAPAAPYDPHQANITALRTTSAPPAGYAGMSLQERLSWYGTQDWIPQDPNQEQYGNPYARDPQADIDTRTPLSPGIDVPSFVNPYRTVMYSVAGLSTTLPQRVIPGNFKRTYLMVQNLGPGNLFLGIGTDPNAGGTNVLNLVGSQIYEQIGGGFYLPPNPWYPDGLAICSSFVSPEYISLLTDTANTGAMILEGTFSPPRVGSHAS